MFLGFLSIEHLLRELTKQLNSSSKYMHYCVCASNKTGLTCRNVCRLRVAGNVHPCRNTVTCFCVRYNWCVHSLTLSDHRVLAISVCDYPIFTQPRHIVEAEYHRATHTNSAVPCGHLDSWNSEVPPVRATDIPASHRKQDCHG